MGQSDNLRNVNPSTNLLPLYICYGVHLFDQNLHQNRDNQTFLRSAKFRTKLLPLYFCSCII
jgi:hypothetical protein